MRIKVNIIFFHGLRHKNSVDKYDVILVQFLFNSKKNINN